MDHTNDKILTLLHLLYGRQIETLSYSGSTIDTDEDNVQNMKLLTNNFLLNHVLLMTFGTSGVKNTLAH